MQVVTANCQYIKTGVKLAAFFLHKIQRCFLDLLLFGWRDAGGRAAEVAVLAVTYFNKHQRLLVLHNQVNFTKAAVKISLQQAQPLLLQMLAGHVLGQLALIAVIEQVDQGQAAVSGH